jgi:4-azaleucine resistance transporter AzlC
LAGPGRRGFLKGLRASVPVVIGYLPAAVALGVAARAAGLSNVEAVVMSLMVYSGASQFALVGLVVTGASWLLMTVVALVLAVRHILYGPSLAPHLRRVGRGGAAIAAFGLTDEVFAVASVKLGTRAQSTRLGWLLGLEAGAYTAWVLGTWIGGVAGTAVVARMPSLAPALSFALPALFVALLVSLVKAGDMEPRGVSRPVSGAVLAAAVVATALSLAGLGSWSVPAAGLAGPIVGLMLWRGRAGAG